LAGYQEVAAKISEALETAGKCSANDSIECYSLLQEQLGELDVAAKRSLRTDVAYQPLVAKLEQGAPLTEADLSTLRSLIVGEADQYLKYDDEFNRTKAELGRILDQVRELGSRDLDPETLMHLRVLCKEASGALAPAMHYLEQKDRVQKFEEHTRSPLSREASHVLAGIIKEDLAD
jgi:hypothetical protein